MHSNKNRVNSSRASLIHSCLQKIINFFFSGGQGGSNINKVVVPSTNTLFQFSLYKSDERYIPVLGLTFQFPLSANCYHQKYKPRRIYQLSAQVSPKVTLVTKSRFHYFSGPSSAGPSWYMWKHKMLLSCLNTELNKKIITFLQPASFNCPPEILNDVASKRNEESYWSIPF